MTDQPTDIRVELAKLLTDVDQSNAITTDQMHQLQVGLEGLWAKTEGDEESHALLVQTWDRAVLLAEQNASLSFQVLASGNIAQAALAESKVAREELENIQDAIYNADVDHPMLMDLALTIRDDIEEELDERVMEEIWPEAMESAFEDHHENLQSALTNLTGCDWRAAAEAAAILEGFSEPTTSQLELLRAFVMECDSVVRRHDANLAAGRKQAAQELKEFNERGA